MIQARFSESCSFFYRVLTFVKLVNRVLPITDEYNSGENAVIREETANSLR